ncbi:MAG: T9SS type A sorting domain-containing protein [Ignavibacteria bacterium]|nr:T9SS type A sorting domain-containing protein [Ignavibacteria bacterium]MBT8383426.1 T9SS type A sorting domain-containing protein [Ignavibacteria bacterium]MBT8391213.1 T9SS type A sorting domain-containing protein [Ignavibacteria bacterium]NNL22440.1 T9SS type A sorting domain-containing protein [Ignavibacteriaceae bacterium]
MLAFDTDNYSDGDYRIIVEVYDESGNFDIDSMDVKFKNGNPVDTEDEEGELFAFRLEQNYPNPFNPTTKIKFELPDQNRVTLKVYNVLGNEIATLINKDKPSGTYEIEFDATGLPSGIYFYELHAGNFVETRKMILLK